MTRKKFLGIMRMIKVELNGMFVLDWLIDLKVVMCIYLKVF